MRQVRRIIMLLCMISCFSISTCFAQSPLAPKPIEKPLTPTEFLEKVWPGYPEWLAMLGEIMAGNPPAAGSGWYRKGVTKTRFNWTYVAGKFDKDKDGAISRAEFPGTDAEFERLDRNRDGSIKPNDLSFAVAGGSETFALEAFATADRDGDGRLTRQEYASFMATPIMDPAYRKIFERPKREIELRLARGEREKLGYLTLADFQDAFALTAGPASAPPTTGATASTKAKSKKPAKASPYLVSFLRQELGVFHSGPDLNDPSPDFAFIPPKSDKEVQLSGLIGPKPIVLIFGNFTCGPFRSQAGSIERLYQRYQGQVEFYVIYTREAHPTDGWQLDDNKRNSINFAQPREFDERRRLANQCRSQLSLQMPVIVDTMTDRVGTLYSGMPNRLYLIDRQGKIAYKGGRGTFGFNPAELEQALIFGLLSGE